MCMFDVKYMLVELCTEVYIHVRNIIGNLGFIFFLTVLFPDWNDCTAYIFDEFKN